MVPVIGCVVTRHDLSLVGLAVAVCIVSCWTTLGVLQRVGSGKQARGGWLIATGAVFGAGIWATHFISELAFRSDFALGYAPSLTALSLALAIIGSMGGFAIVTGRIFGRWSAVVGGVAIGATIAAMHFTGMVALRFPGRLQWSAPYVVASILIGIAFAVLAMLVLRRRDELAARLLATTLLTLGIGGLHFTAMIGIVLVPMAVPVPADLLAGTPLALVVAAAVALILMIGLGCAVLDEQAARRAEAELRRIRRFADATFEGILFQQDGIVTDANALMCRLLGAPAERIIGAPLARLLPALGGLSAPWPNEALETELVVGTTATLPVEILIRPLDETDQARAVVAVRDITERRAAAQRIHFLAHHDALTGLPNRVLFNDRPAQAMALAERSGRNVALLFLDLDGFKAVNDALGHAAGDFLLRGVADRLVAELREMDTVARLGGDEFAIIQPLGDQPQEAAVVARRMVDLLGMPFEINGDHAVIGVSIGIALFPTDAGSAETLMRSADLALFRAKHEGRGTFCFFEPAMDQRLQRRRLLEQDLRRAIEQDELEIHYQPLCRCDSLAVIGHEALLRWNHPTRGPIAPSEFIPLAEESGLIIRLGRAVLERACREGARWPGGLTLAVNISPVQFGQRDLVAMVDDILRRTGLPPERLEIEVTEGILISNTGRALQVLRGFKQLGVRITLDDFGTGYSSLGYLRRFPFDAIKIDRSFVHGLGVDREAGMIVQSILALCRSLDLRATAEGVETEAQLASLSALGCDLVQGFLLGRPVGATHIDHAEPALRA